MGSALERGELVEQINIHWNRWPDSNRGDAESNLAQLAENRLLKVIGDQRVIWANGGPGSHDNGSVSLSAVVFTEGYVITDDVTAVGHGGIPREGTTRVIPWAELTGLTMREYRPAGAGSETESAWFVVHLGAALDVEVKPGRMAGQSAASELLVHVLGKLAAKQ